MPRKASSKPADSTAAHGFGQIIRAFGSRHSGFVISPARRLAIINLALRGIEATAMRDSAVKP